jgi:hypothetical protein
LARRIGAATRETQKTPLSNRSGLIPPVGSTKPRDNFHSGPIEATGFVGAADLFGQLSLRKMSLRCRKELPSRQGDPSDHTERQVSPKPWLARPPDKKSGNASNPSTDSSLSQIGADATQRPAGHKKYGGLLCRPGRSVRRRKKICPRVGVRVPPHASGNMTVSVAD